MRTSLRRVSQIVLIAVIVAGSSLVFQNCAGYAPAEIAEVIDPASLCEGASCASNPESIQLAIANADPERLIPTDRAFDVGGYCDPAGYPSSRIVWQVIGPTNIGPVAVNNACDELGRFQIRVDLPNGFAFGTAHILRVQLRAIDAQGREVDNPLGLNRREISIVSPPGS